MQDRIQDRIQDKDLAIRKVPGDANPADMMTKHLGEQKKLNCTSAISLIHREGRAVAGLHVQHGNSIHGNAKIV